MNGFESHEELPTPPDSQSDPTAHTPPDTSGAELAEATDDSVGITLTEVELVENILRTGVFGSSDAPPPIWSDNDW